MLQNERNKIFTKPNRCLAEALNLTFQGYYNANFSGPLLKIQLF